MDCGEGGIASRDKCKGGGGGQSVDPAAASGDGRTFERNDAGDRFLCVEARGRESAEIVAAVRTNQRDACANEPAFAGDVSEDGGQHGGGVEREIDGASE